MGIRWVERGASVTSLPQSLKVVVERRIRWVELEGPWSREKRMGIVAWAGAFIDRECEQERHKKPHTKTDPGTNRSITSARLSAMFMLVWVAREHVPDVRIKEHTRRPEASPTSRPYSNANPPTHTQDSEVT